MDDAHVTYTGWNYGDAYARHLDNGSGSSYKERITAGVNTFSLIMGGVQTATETAVLGRFSIAMQGELGDELFGGKLNKFSKNFKTFDNFSDGIATSAKSMDLGRPTYLSRPSAITSRLNAYVRSIAKFTQAKGGGFVLDASDISARKLGLLTIGYPNEAQLSAILTSQQYAARKGIQFTMKSMPLSDPLIKALLLSPKPSSTQIKTDGQNN